MVVWWPSLRSKSTMGARPSAAVVEALRGLFARAGARRVLDAGIAVKMLVLALGLIRG